MVSSARARRFSRVSSSSSRTWNFSAASVLVSWPASVRDTASACSSERVAVTDEPVSVAIGLAHPISHQSVGQIRWHQVTGVEVLFGRHAEFCPSADTFAKKLSNGDVPDHELTGQLVGCVPLPAPGGPIKILLTLLLLIGDCLVLQGVMLSVAPHLARWTVPLPVCT